MAGQTQGGNARTSRNTRRPSQTPSSTKPGFLESFGNAVGGAFYDLIGKNARRGPGGGSSGRKTVRSR